MLDTLACVDAYVRLIVCYVYVVFNNSSHIVEQGRFSTVKLSCSQVHSRGVELASVNL